MIIDFFQGGDVLTWRWDELVPSKELRFPSTAPDFAGTGHVGRFSFKYSLLSAAAEAFATEVARAERRSPAAGNERLLLPGKLALVPQGVCEVGWQIESHFQESCRDFARVFYSSGEARLFLRYPGKEKCQSLGAPAPASGALGADAVNSAMGLLGQQLAQGVGFTLPLAVIRRIIASMAVAVGIKFTSAFQLLPVFLQPAYVIVCTREPLQVRLLTYGYIVKDAAEVQGDQPDRKSSPFVVCITSPELTADPTEGESYVVRYAAQIAQSPYIAEHLSEDLPPVIPIWPPHSSFSFADSGA